MGDLGILPKVALRENRQKEAKIRERKRTKVKAGANDKKEVRVVRAIIGLIDRISLFGLPCIGGFLICTPGALIRGLNLLYDLLCLLLWDP